MKFSNAIASFAIALHAAIAAPLHSSSLSLEEKIGQMMMVHFNGDSANATAESLVKEVHVGAVILFNWSNGLTSPEQVRSLTSGLQKFAGSTPTTIPLLIAIDQEGGIVTRLTEGFTFFPGNRALAMTMDSSIAYRYAHAMGMEQLEVGINMTLAPVVDVAPVETNSVIGVRSYGSDPMLVFLYGAGALMGYRDAGIISTLKHYPGLGGLTVDPHHDMPINNSCWDTFHSRDLAPFAMLAGSADVIMTGHVITNALDPEECTTFSKPSLDYLRDVCGFNGIILSDSLVMDAITHTSPSIEESAIKAICAGCDMLLLGGKQLNERGSSNEIGLSEIKSIQKAICEAVVSGRIDKGQIDRSVSRILALKNRLSSIAAKEYSRRDEHCTVVEEIVRRSLKMTVHQPGSARLLNEGDVLIVAPLMSRKAIEEVLGDMFGQRATTHFYESTRHLDPLIHLPEDLAKNADRIIFFSYNAWKSPFQKMLLNSIIATGKPLFLISLADEEDLRIAPGIVAGIASYNPSPASIKYALEKLITLEETH